MNRYHLSFIFILLLQISLFAQYQIDSVTHIQDDFITRISQKQGKSLKTSEKKYTRIDRSTHKLIDGIQEVRQYDESQNEVTTTILQWDELSLGWLELEKIERDYDSSNRLIGFREYIKSNNNWKVQVRDEVLYTKDSIMTIVYSSDKPYSKNVGYFDNNQNETRTINYQWESVTNQWVFWTKIDYEYIRDSVIKEIKSYSWEDQKWTPNEKTVYFFDDKREKVSQSIWYAGKENKWELRSKSSSSYISEKRLETDTLYTWSVQDKKWNPDMIYLSYLDENNKETSYLAIKINQKTGKEEVLNERMSLYDSEGRVTLYQEFFFKDNQPEQAYQQSYKFDSDGNLIQNTFLELEVITNQWKEVTMTEFYLNTDIQININSEFVISDTYNLGFYNYKNNKNPVSQAKVYHFQNGEKKLSEHVIFHYSLIR